MRENHVKRLLKAGQPAVGTWLSLPSPPAAEQMAQLGFDLAGAAAGDGERQPARHGGGRPRARHL